MSLTVQGRFDSGPRHCPHTALTAPVGASIALMTMTTLTCLLATLLAVLTIPLAVLLWATESRAQRIRRLKRSGWTWKRIAARYGCAPSTAARWATLPA